MTGSAVNVVTNLLQNLGNPEVVQSLIATDAVYVSLNQDNADLKQILPWAGTHHGPSSFTDALGTMFTWWANERFDPTDIVGMVSIRLRQGIRRPLLAGISTETTTQPIRSDGLGKS